MKLRIALLVILFIMAAVFIGLTVWGGIKSGSASNANPSLDPTQLAGQWAGLRDTLSKPPELTAQEIAPDSAQSTSNDCLRLQEVLIAPPGATCTFTIAEAAPNLIGIRSSVRKLHLSLTVGQAAALSIQQKIHQDNGNELTASQAQTVEAGTQPGSADIYSSGGTLTVVCQSAVGRPACRLTLGQLTPGQ